MTTKLATWTLLIAMLATSACATTTNIATTPQGARVYVDGKEICAQSPCVWDTQMALPRRYHLQVRKPGYQEVDLYVDKEIAVLWWLVANVVTYGTGAGLLTPFVYRLDEKLSFDLVALSPADNPPQTGSLPPAAPEENAPGAPIVPPPPQTPTP